MVRLYRISFFLACIFFFINNTNAQTSISGTVYNEQKEPLIGANLLIEATEIGATTDIKGQFKIEINTKIELPFRLLVSYTGFQSQSILIEKLTTLEIILLEGVYINLNEDFVISASRKKEKITEAPASISVLSARELAVSPNVNPTQSLANLAGVHLLQQSANRVNIEIRGDMNLFSTSVFPIMDYRNLISSGAGLFQSSGSGLSNIDLERIEVVRGPGSALYGPGVTAGVVHFITKNPIDYPGTTIEIQGGELATIGIAARHATKVNDKFGFKINTHFNRGNEFSLDPNSADSIYTKTYATQVYQPAIRNNAVDLNGEKKILVENLDEDGDGNPIANDYYNFTLNATAEFRPKDDLVVFLSAGYNNFNEVFYNNQGPGLSQVTNYWGQARMQMKGLFAQLYYSNRVNPEEKPTFLYNTGAVSAIDQRQLEGQLQYNFGVKKLLNADITVGSDYRATFSDSKNNTYGRNEANDDYWVAGVYGQANFELKKDQLHFLVAGRFDRTNVLDENIISPRMALVYQPAKNHNIRATFNRSASAPSALNSFLDLPINQIIPQQFIIWAHGTSQLTSFDDNNNIDLTVAGLPDIPIGSEGLPLEVIYNQINSTVTSNYNFGNDDYDIQNFLSNYTPSGVSGQLEGYNLGTGERITPLNQAPLGLRFFDTYEVGYNSFVNNHLKITFDFYYNQVTGFTKFTALAPTYRLVNANISDDLNSALLDDLTDYLMNDYGLSSADALSAAQPIIDAFGAESTLFNNEIAPFLNLFGAAEGNVVPDDDAVVYLPFGYQNFNNTIDYYGMDLGLKYYFTPNITGYANFSYLSQTEWIPGTNGDDGLDFQYFLNTPRYKFRIGGTYTPVKGFFGSLSFQHTPSYNIDLGLYSGASDIQNVFDASFGYTFENGIKVALTGTNVFNNKFRAVPNFPLIGRRILAKVVYDFGSLK